MNEVGNMVCDYKSIYEYQSTNFTKFSLWLDAGLKAKLREKAREEGMTMSEYIRYLLARSI